MGTLHALWSYNMPCMVRDPSYPAKRIPGIICTKPSHNHAIKSEIGTKASRRRFAGLCHQCLLRPQSLDLAEYHGPATSQDLAFLKRNFRVKGFLALFPFLSPIFTIVYGAQSNSSSFPYILGKILPILERTKSHRLTAVMIIDESNHERPHNDPSDPSAPDSEANPRETRPFLRFPGELREKIYKYTLVRDVPVLYQEPRDLAILQTCRQINREAYHIYQTMNKFKIHDTERLPQWLWRIGNQRRQCLRSVEISYPFEDRPPLELLSDCSRLSVTFTSGVSWLEAMWKTKAGEELRAMPNVTMSRPKFACEFHGQESLRLVLGYPKLPLPELSHLIADCCNGCPYHGNGSSPGDEFSIHVVLQDCCLLRG